VEDDRFEGMSKDVKSLLKYRNKTVNSLEAASWVSTCSECEAVKPVRTRHCSVCNRCVFQADHHSPWINNCVGLENQRFYLLFIFYLLLGVGYNLCSIMSIWNHYLYKENYQLMNFIFVMDVSLSVILSALNLWHWALTMTGLTSVDIICGGKVISCLT
jgi:palmitoyltransferase